MSLLVFAGKGIIRSVNFIQNFKQSFYSPRFYKELRGKSIWFSFRYFFTLVGLLAVLVAALWSAPAIKGTRSFLDSLVPYLHKYPAELVVVIKDGKASTNVPEPYFIKTPSGLCEGSSSASPAGACAFENIFTIDTRTPYEEAKFKEYKTMA